MQQEIEQEEYDRSWIRINVGSENKELVNNLTNAELNEELNILRDMLIKTQEKFKSGFLQRRAGK